MRSRFVARLRFPARRFLSRAARFSFASPRFRKAGVLTLPLSSSKMEVDMAVFLQFLGRMGNRAHSRECAFDQGWVESGLEFYP